MKEEVSYIINLRNSLKPELRNIPLIQPGSAIIVENEKGEILLQSRSDRDKWGLPGGTQDIPETLEEVAIRELKEETGLEAKVEDLILITIVSGKTRYNTYPNGDEVYNNTALYLVKKYNGELKCDFESLKLNFVSLDNLPKNLMDRDLIEKYIEYNLKK